MTSSFANRRRTLTSKFDPEHYTVEQRKYNTIIAKRDGKTVTRNVSHFKKVVMEESEEEQEDTAPGRSTETGTTKARNKCKEINKNEKTGNTISVPDLML